MLYNLSKDVVRICGRDSSVQFMSALSISG